MARKFLTSIDFSNLEALNFRFQNLAADPSSGVGPGSAYFDTVNNKLKVRSSTGYYDPTDRSTHTGTQLANTISNFAATAAAVRLDQFAVPTTVVSMNGQRLINLAPGTTGTDAVNKNQLDAVLNGTDWKESVRVATTGNIVLSGIQNIDGLTMVAGNRVLVKDQTAASGNGIYIVSAGAWARAADAVQGTLTASSAVMVEEGTSWSSTQWRLTTLNPITVGTSPLNWSQIGAVVSYTNGVGISIVGTVIGIDPAVVVRKFAANIGNGSATTIQVVHSLGTKDVTYSIRQVSDDAIVDCDVVSTDVNTVTLMFAVAPLAASLRVVIHG